MAYAVGIDIGGTKVAVGIVGEDGRLCDRIVLPTDIELQPAEMIDRICAELEGLVDRAGIALDELLGIGIGAPGPLDAKKGLIACPPNLPGWTDVPIVETMQGRYALPVVLENDANAATLAEKWIGAAQESDHFVYVTVSTGIGAGLYLDGKLVSGSRGNAGDIGHIVIDPARGTCTCGQKGCLEWIASGSAIARRGSELLGGPYTTQEIFERYREGNAHISALIEDTFTAIGIGCVTLINLFDPERIVIGGGVSQVGSPLFRAVQQYVNRHALNPAGRRTKIIPAMLSQEAGVIGAAALILLPEQRGWR
ncbi:MAG: ROK family protein [Tumebacillaceae bacterium]